MLEFTRRAALPWTVELILVPYRGATPPERPGTEPSPEK